MKKEALKEILNDEVLADKVLEYYHSLKFVKFEHNADKHRWEAVDAH